jgi:alpha-amylase
VLKYFLLKKLYFQIIKFKGNYYYFFNKRGELNPWYWIYQPVSYKLSSRMGTRKQLREMILTCRRNGVRVYADAVINHMR